MITITFVRHGQSTDNIVPLLWAGWKDAPLSDHGMKQAAAVGSYFASYHITHIFSSDLKRAHSTAQAIYEAQPNPKPPLTVTQILRERHWGDAEGNLANPPWEPTKGREGKFKNGESLDDVARRGDLFFNEYLASIIKEAKGKPFGEINVVVASHGVAISENIGALLKRSVYTDDENSGSNFTGLLNTAWTRVVVGLEDETLPSGDIAGPPHEHDTLSTPDQGAVLATAVEKSAPPSLEGPNADHLAIKAKVIARNQHSHLKDLVEQVDKSDSSVDDSALKMQNILSGGAAH